jgi:hypothetical protein
MFPTPRLGMAREKPPYLGMSVEAAVAGVSGYIFGEAVPNALRF